MNLHLALLLSYASLLIVLGLLIGRRVRVAADFFVAGRRLGPGLLFSTMLAANIGAGSTVNAAGLGYRDGLSAWWWVGSAGLGSLALAFWIGPRIRRIAARHDLRTVGDFLEHRYGPTVRALIATLLWFGALAILAVQLIAMAWVLNVITGVPKYAGCLIGGLVMTTYFAAGGLIASAWVNLAQLVVLLIGFGVAVPLALGQVGGWDTLVGATQAVPRYWSFWGGASSGWMYLPMLAPAFIVSPGLLQKIYGASDDRTVRLGVGWTGAVLLVFAFVPPLLGMMARALHPSLVNPELALPTLLMDSLPPLVGGLGLAALFSAEVSSADAILFMLSTSLSQDVYKRFVAPTASDAAVLRVARWAAVVGGSLGVALAIVAESMVEVLSVFYTLLTVSLFIPVMAGLYVRRVNTAEAVAAIAAGVTVALAYELGTDGAGTAGLSPAMLGLIAATLGCTAVALVKSRSGTARSHAHVNQPID